MLKRNKRAWLWALVCSCQMTWGWAASQEDLFATLQKSPWEAKSMQALQALMRNEREPVALRSRAMAICTLSFLHLGNTNQFIKASHVLDGAFPGEKGLITVSIAENFEDCSVCAGKGRREANCPGCKGSACQRCKGMRVISTVCTACRGTKQQFKLSPAVQENYVRLLKESINIAQQNLLFEKESALALGEKDTAKKIALLEAVLSGYSTRIDLDPLKKSLEDAKKIRDAEVAKKKEQERRNKEEKDVERLRGLRDVLAGERESAINELEMYLIKNPKCFARNELEELKAELTTKVTLRKRLIASLLWLIGLGGGFVCIVFLKTMIFPRKAERSGPLPGMARIDKNKFTDPLAEEREKNHARQNGEGP